MEAILDGAFPGGRAGHAMCLGRLSQTASCGRLSKKRLTACLRCRRLDPCRWPCEVDLVVYSFGSPRVGNRAFALDYNRRLPHTWRIVSVPVPAVLWIHAIFNIKKVHVGPQPGHVM